MCIIIKYNLIQSSKNIILVLVKYFKSKKKFRVKPGPDLLSFQINVETRNVVDVLDGRRQRRDVEADVRLERRAATFRRRRFVRRQFAVNVV